jgi:DNA ligase-1
MNKKIDKIKFLLVSCRNNEARYLIRYASYGYNVTCSALEGKLRIGLAEQTVLVALAHASVLCRGGKHSSHDQSDSVEKKKSEEMEASLAKAAATVKQVYSEVPTYEKMVPVLLDHGIDRIEEFCKMTPGPSIFKISLIILGIPLKPMLAHPTKAISDVLNRFENVPFTCEYKYDGERAQIHKLDGDRMLIFSRNQENMSQKYPDIMEHMKVAPKAHVHSFVLDTEAVAWDREKKVILPFQVLSTRKRKV